MRTGMMTKNTDLKTLIRSMRPAAHPEPYVFVSLPPDAEVPPALRPAMTFREKEGVTLILASEDADAAGLTGTFACRMIALNVQSSLEAVGFLAAILPPLAEAGIPVNAVSAFHQDHLFVPVDMAEPAVAILEQLARR